VVGGDHTHVLHKWPLQSSKLSLFPRMLKIGTAIHEGIGHIWLGHVILGTLKAKIIVVVITIIAIKGFPLLICGAGLMAMHFWKS
jgi:hypothetical protein